MSKDETKKVSREEPVAGGMTFQRFVLKQTEKALIALGEVADPLTGRKARSLQKAQEKITVLSLLDEKTRGNLTEYEQQTLQNSLFDLQNRYVEAVKRQANEKSKS